MADLAEFLLRPLGLGLLWLLRGLLWLGWELLFSTIGWSIGWFICRVLTFGRVPGVGIRDEDNYDLLPRLFVELIGLGFLASAVWWLARILNA